MRKKLLVFVLSLALLVSATSCSSGLVKAFGDASALQDLLAQKYEWKAVRVTISNGFALGISFINSPFNQLDPAAKEARAREIAIFARRNYGSMDQLTQIFVSFVIYDKIYGLLDFTNSLDTFFFEVADLDALSPDMPLTNEYRTVYVVKPAASGLFAETFTLLGAIPLGGGAILTAASIYFARKRKENAIYLGVAFGVGAVLLGFIFVVVGLSFGTLVWRDQNKYARAYEQNAYQIVEGPVSVLSQESRQGRTFADTVRIGDKTFRLSHSALTSTYHQTIAYGGILHEGVYARVYYVGDAILRIDAKSP